MKHALAALGLVLSVGAANASAWGCDGHQTVAILAERLLSPTTIGAIRTVLAGAAADPRIKPFCPEVAGDPIATAATWADDFRTVDPSTGSWHYINFPLIRAANPGSYQQYCANGQCIVDVVNAQFETLTTSFDPLAKANALRFLMHFIGDLHQPLHTTTNGDRGGNCLPITYYDQTPVEDAFHNFRPNLHGVWDDGTIRRWMAAQGLADSRALAARMLAAGRLRRLGPVRPTPAIVAAWAREGNAIARNTVYGRLPVAVPREPAETFSLSSCDANSHASTRMAGLHERIDGQYERASVPVILSQLRLAAERLAAVLTAAFPG